MSRQLERSLDNEVHNSPGRDIPVSGPDPVRQVKKKWRDRNSRTSSTSAPVTPTPVPRPDAYGSRLPVPFGVSTYSDYNFSSPTTRHVDVRTVRRTGEFWGWYVRQGSGNDTLPKTTESWRTGQKRRHRVTRSGPRRFGAQSRGRRSTATRDVTSSGSTQDSKLFPEYGQRRGPSIKWRISRLWSVNRGDVWVGP